jgi:hypothetical protein
MDLRRPTRARRPALAAAGVTLLALLATTFLAPPASAAPNYGKSNNGKKPEGPPPVVVMRFTGAERGRYYGHDVLIVNGRDALDGSAVQVAIHNADDKSNKFDPRQDQMDVIKGLQPGDYAKVEAEIKDTNQVWARKIQRYDAKPGEEQPNVFVVYEGTFTKREGEQDLTLITLTKFGQVVDAMIPMKKADGGKALAPDPVLAQRAGAFKKGDVVEAELKPGPVGSEYATLANIEAFKTPEQAKFEKVGETEIDGQKYPTVELNQDGKTLSLPVVGHQQGKKLVPDFKVVNAAKSLRAGTEVSFRTRDEEGKTWLREIQRAPAQPAVRPAGKPAAKAEKSGTK